MYTPKVQKCKCQDYQYSGIAIAIITRVIKVALVWVKLPWKCLTKQSQKQSTQPKIQVTKDQV